MSRRHNRFDEYRAKFFRVPKVFVTNDKYIKMSNNAKIAYAILQDRQELSIKNGWYDKNGDIYFVYSNPQLMEIMNLSKQTTINVKKELVGAELLEEEPTGRANRMYLLKPEVTETDIYKIDETENVEAEKAEDLLPKKEGSDLESQAKSKNHTSDEVQNLDSRGQEIRQQIPKNHTSDVQNLDPNDTELSDTDSIETESSENLNLNHMNEYIWQLRLPMPLKKFFSDKVKVLVTTDTTFDISEIEYFYNTYRDYIDPFAPREDVYHLNDIEFTKCMKKMYSQVQRPIGSMEGLIKKWVLLALSYKRDNNEEYEAMGH